MKKILFIGILLLHYLHSMGQNITRIEYFFDTDPGFGSATSIPITPNPNIVNLAASIDINSLSTGVHDLYVRSQDANGNWSIVNKSHFYKMANASGAVHITKLEYFFDTDPGFGNATSIPLTPSVDIVNLNASIDISALPTGVHDLYVRSKDANGNWSIVNKSHFYKMANASGAVHITKLEYFFDTDPGFGNATSIPLTPSVDIVNLNASIDISALPTGVHDLYVRGKDANGNWSIVNKSHFYKMPNAPGAAAITRIEYYFSTDPGYGNATSIPFTTNTDIIDLNASIDISALPIGVHNLHVRSLDAYGNWSILNKSLFYKMSLPTVLPKITKMEYYINSDPGFGNGVPVSFTNGEDIANKVIAVNVSGLSVATHRLYIRSRDSLGKWSVTHMQEFTVPSTYASPSVMANSTDKTIYCANDSLFVGYQKTGTFNAGNVFTLQLSNATGSFASPTNIGSITATANGIIKAKLPSHISTGTGYKIRITSTNPVRPPIVFVDALTIYDRPNAATITGPNDLNVNNAGSYSVVNVAGSSWLWLSNSGTVASTANTSLLSWSTPGIPKTIHVIETNSDGCSGDTSTKAVNVYTPDIINASANGSSFCTGSTFTISAAATGVYTSNTFTAQLSDALGSFNTPINIGSVNLSPIGSNQAVSITCIIPNNTAEGTGYKVRIMASSPSVTSLGSSASITINSVNMSVTSNPSNAIICNGSPITLTASGASIYSWSGGITNGVPFYPTSTTTYTVTGTNSTTGCTKNATITVIVDPCPSSVLNLSAFIEGYYIGASELTAALNNQGLPNPTSHCDSILVNLHSSAAPYDIVYTAKVVLSTNGQALCTFPAAAIGNSYYIGVKHRNSIETWSNTSVLMSAITSYNFTDAASKAYGNNQVEVEPNVFAFYSGDMDQNGYLELDDYNLWDFEYQAGYPHSNYAPDLDGNGYVELDDYNIWDLNYQNGVYIIRP